MLFLYGTDLRFKVIQPDNRQRVGQFEFSSFSWEACLQNRERSRPDRRLMLSDGIPSLALRVLY